MHNDPGPRAAIDPSPESCGSMGELRAAIDSLDRRLVAMLALRQRYIERAAVLKSSRMAVRDEARIADVVAKVIAAGSEAGLSPAIAEAVWRTLIEASIAHEFVAFDGKAGHAQQAAPYRPGD